MVCALLIISIHFPFTSKPERIYTSLRRRFFLHCARLAVAAAGPTGGTNWWNRLRLQGGMALLAKLHHWGAMIDQDLFPGVGQDKIKALNDNCDLLQGQLLVLYRKAEAFRENPLIADIDAGARVNLLRGLCRELAQNRGQAAFDEARDTLSTIEQRLDEHLGTDYQDRHGRHELAQFYIYLSLQASIVSSLYACLEAQNEVDWSLLGKARF